MPLLKIKWLPMCQSISWLYILLFFWLHISISLLYILKSNSFFLSLLFFKIGLNIAYPLHLHIHYWISMWISTHVQVETHPPTHTHLLVSFREMPIQVVCPYLSAHFFLLLIFIFGKSFSYFSFLHMYMQKIQLENIFDAVMHFIRLRSC